MAKSENPDSSVSFALRLYQQLASKLEENLFFSPASVAATLSIALLGARNKTRQEILEVLGIDDETKVHAKNLDMLKGGGKETVLRCACQVFPDLQFTLQEEFQEACRKFYGSSIEALDFKQCSEDSRKFINDWAQSATEGKIKELLPAGCLNAQTRLVLANAIYFKGNWMHKFNEADTRTAKFYVSENKAVDVQMMTQQRKYNFYHDPAAELQVVEIPYAGGDVCLTLLVPTKRCGLSEVETVLTDSYLQNIGTKFSEQEVLLSLPKLSIEHSIVDLHNHLRLLGIADLFDNNRADLTGISRQAGLHATSLVHKAALEINEEGTEAAAATAVTIGFLMLLPPVAVTCDHPFMVLIKDKSRDLILFVGRFMSP